MKYRFQRFSQAKELPPLTDSEDDEDGEEFSLIGSMVNEV